LKITVLGGGHGCYAAAAELSEAGHDVTLWRRDGAALGEISAAGGLTVRDYKGIRTIPVAQAGHQGLHLETDLGVAVDGSALLVVPLPSTSHENLARAVAPHLQEGQVVFLPPGTFGSYLFARALKESGNTANAVFAETGTLPYLARKHGAAEVVISCYAVRLPTGVLPAALSGHAFAVLKEAYPSVEPLDDVLSGALMNAGPVIHPPLIVMNAGPLEYFEAWDIHNEGTQPSVRRVTSALDNERIAVREALGYQAPHFPVADHYASDGEEWMYGRGAHGKLTESGDWREKIDLQSHRYMLEDTRLGLSFLVSVGRWAGVPTPVAQGLLSVAAAASDRDLYSEGRTFESLGLAELSVVAMQEVLQLGLK
jgi:opine dehydrogenase